MGPFMRKSFFGIPSESFSKNRSQLQRPARIFKNFDSGAIILSRERKTKVLISACADPESFVRGGPTLTF